MSDTIKIRKSNGVPITVSKDDYIKAKLRDLLAFGYDDLTEKEITTQLEAAIKGEGMNVIGLFIEKDLVK